ncbi:MAG: hypothetical protein IPK79_00500 [Vampirovibrionales bacterium]|nr:hypothetical protein [Vampirovibrionales bacterium]
MNASEFEITDGYVGSFGVTFKPATAETLAAAIEKAATMNNTTVPAIEFMLAGGATVRWCESPNYYYDHGYGVIRRKRTPQPVKLVRCSCGHSVPAAQVMNASLGTSCPDCYDRMSD